jgi:hypothetical protein
MTNCKAVKILDRKVYAKSSLTLTQFLYWPFCMELMENVSSTNSAM